MDIHRNNRKTRYCLILVAMIFVVLLNLLAFQNENNKENVLILQVQKQGLYSHTGMNNTWIVLFNCLNHKLEKARVVMNKQLLSQYKAWYYFSDLFLFSLFSSNLNGYKNPKYLAEVQDLEHVTTIVYKGSSCNAGNVNTTIKQESSFKYPTIYKSGITEWHCSKEAENNNTVLPSAECLNGTNQKLHFILDKQLEVSSKSPSVYIHVMLHGKVNPEGVVRAKNVNIMPDQCFPPWRVIKVNRGKKKYSEVKSNLNNNNL